MKSSRKAARALPPAFALLQQALEQMNSGNLQEAQYFVRKGLALAPRNVELWNVAGACAMRLGDMGQAEQCWRQAVALEPRSALLHMNLGTLLAQCQRVAEAEQCYREAIARDPGLAAAHFSLGALLGKIGRGVEAEACYRRAIALDPRHADAYYNLGALLLRGRRYADAETCLRQALALNPAHVAALGNLGALLAKTARMADAESCYRQALGFEPRSATLHLNLGRLLMDQDRDAEAEPCLRQALALDGMSTQVLNSLGALLKKTQRLEEAQARFERVIEIEPADLVAHLGMAALQEQRGRPDEAERILREAAIRGDGATQDRYALACSLLYFGLYREAWPHYESRLAADFEEAGRPPPPVSFPRWQGESLAGKSLLIWPEQGFGDVIQFCRYVALLKAQGVSRLTLVCHAALVPLLRSLTDVDAVVTHDKFDRQPPAAHDYWTFLLSIPLHCGTTLDSIPSRLPYLHAPPERVARWAPYLPRDSFRVGLVWKGSERHRNDSNRSLPNLATLAPLWSVPGVTFVSLQKGPGEGEVRIPPAAQPLHRLAMPVEDFADTAAIATQLDLVISVDTATAHLAGALDVPCWVLLPERNVDWRWLRNRGDSPWYSPSMRLFRQAEPGNWAAVVEEVRRDLDTIVTARRDDGQSAK
jgi:tetratricopeptide (TPR) repeat protein